MVQDSSEREVATRAVGEMIMKELKNLDKVAYVRFASVYLDFKDVPEFMNELKEFTEKPRIGLDVFRIPAGTPSGLGTDGGRL